MLGNQVFCAAARIAIQEGQENLDKQIEELGTKRIPSPVSSGTTSPCTPPLTRSGERKLADEFLRYTTIQGFPTSPQHSPQKERSRSGSAFSSQAPSDDEKEKDEENDWNEFSPRETKNSKQFNQLASNYAHATMGKVSRSTSSITHSDSDPAHPKQSQGTKDMQSKNIGKGKEREQDD